MKEHVIYQELDREIEKLIMGAEMDIRLETETIKACKATARKMIDSGEYTVEVMIERVKKLLTRSVGI